MIGQILPSLRLRWIAPPLDHSQEVSEKLNNYVPQDAQDDTKLFLEADIKAYQSDTGLQALIEHLDTVLLRPFKTAGGKTEMVTPSSRYDTENSVDQCPVVREQEQLRKEGLVRITNVS